MPGAIFQMKYLIFSIDLQIWTPWSPGAKRGRVTPRRTRLMAPRSTKAFQVHCWGQLIEYPIHVITSAPSQWDQRCDGTKGGPRWSEIPKQLRY
jgi:hypothetical protein